MPNDQSWITRVWSEFRADNLTRAWRDVLLCLRTFRGPGGVAWPSHATLATRAGCSVRTVQRALGQARALRLVSWVERRVRAAWRALRTSNAYRLLTPAEPVQPGQRVPRLRRRATTGQEGREGENQTKKAAWQAMLAAAAGLPDLLAMRRATFERRL